MKACELKTRLCAIVYAIIVCLATPPVLFAGEGWVYSQEWFEEIYANCDLSSGEPYAFEQCVGSATEICAARRPDGNTPEGYLACIKKETNSWSLLWDKHKAEIFTHLKMIDRSVERTEGIAYEAFEQSQKEWRTYLEAQCAFEGSLSMNPYLRENSEAYCLLSGTARRVHFLLELTQIQ